MCNSRIRGVFTVVLASSVAPGALAGAAETQVFNLPSQNLAIFGLQWSADFLAPPAGVITESRMILTYTTASAMNGEDLLIEIQAPTKDVPFWTVTGADLGWEGQGTFTATISTDELNGAYDVTPGEFALFFARVINVNPAPLAGQFTNSRIEVDVAPPNAADLNGDGVVNGADLASMLAQWGACAEGAPCPSDLNDDGVTDGADLAQLLANWS